MPCLLSVVRPSVVNISHFWHLLRERKSEWAETWWEALGPHGNSELSKSFRSGIQDCRHGGHLENLQTTSPPEHLRVGFRVLWRFRIARIVLLQYPRWPRVAILKFFKAYFLPNHKSDWAESSELLKLLSSNKQDCGHLKSILNYICYWTVSRIEPKLVGRHGATWRFRIAKMVMFRYQWWPPWRPSWNSSSLRVAKDNLIW